MEHMYKYEYLKNFIKNKAIIMIIITTVLYILLVIGADTPENYQMEYEKNKYTAIAVQFDLFGQVDSTKEKAVKNLEKDYEEKNRTYDKLSTQLRNGAVSMEQFQKRTMPLLGRLHSKNVIDQFAKQISYSVENPENRYLMYSNGWSSVFSMRYDYLLILFSIFLAALIFQREMDDGMYTFLITCTKGKRETIVSKIGLLAVMNILVGLSTYFVFLVYIRIRYGLENGEYPIQSLPAFSGCDANLSIFQTAVLVIGLKILSMMIAGLVTAIFYIIFEKSTGSLSMSILALFLPAVYGTSQRWLMFLPTGLNSSEAVFAGIKIGQELDALNGGTRLLIVGTGVVFFLLFLGLTIMLWSGRVYRK